MNFDYPDLGGSVHAVFDTQLPGAAVDSPSQSQTDSVMNTQAAIQRRAEKAPARDPIPPSFGLFGLHPSSSQDRTQLPFFPATTGSLRPDSPAPEPATANQTMMVAICKTTGLLELFGRKLDSLSENNSKTNDKINLLSHAMGEVIETLNQNLVAFDKLQRSLTSAPLPASRTPLPLPPKPRPEVVIINPVPVTSTRTPLAPALPLNPPPPQPRRAPPRQAKEGPKNYLDKPLTPEPQPPTAPGPSRPSYAQAAEGEFQPVIRKNRNHRNRTPPKSPSPDNQPDRDRQIVVVRQNTEPALNPSLCMTIINNVRSRLQYTTCQGTISLVRSSARGNLIIYSDPKHKAQDLWPYRKQISMGLNDSHIGPFDLQLNLMRLPVYISNVPLSYPSGGSSNAWQPEDWTDSALETLKKDISSSNAVEAVDRPFTIGTLASLKANRMSTCAFVVNLIRSPASIELIQTGHITIGGRRAICREWFPDAHRSYCDRCLSPGHHQIMCRNKTVCKFCRLPHLSNRHRCNTCQTHGFCPSHDQKSCYNCDSTAHFAGDELCPNRTLHRSIDPEERRGQLHDPTTTGRHRDLPHPSRFGPPLPTAPAPAAATGSTRSRAVSISSVDLEARITALLTRDSVANLNETVNAALQRGEDPSHLIPDDDTSPADYTDSHWRPCQCNLSELDRVQCPNTVDAVYDISHDHPFCLCPPNEKEKRCMYFSRFIDEPVIGFTPPDTQLSQILSDAAASLSNQYQRQISVTTSGRILIDNMDPDTPEYNEWAANIDFRPHGSSCHCKAIPGNNIPSTHCPNRPSENCPCYHLPGPIAGIIKVTGANRISILKNKQSHRIAKKTNPTRAHSA